MKVGRKHAKKEIDRYSEGKIRCFIKLGRYRDGKKRSPLLFHPTRKVCMVAVTAIPTRMQVSEMDQTIFFSWKSPN